MPKFEWLNKQGVKSDSGFVVQSTGRFTIEYSEGAKTLEVGVEAGFMGDKPVTSYSRSSFSKWSQDAKEQERVIANFRQALEFQGLVPIEH